MSNGFKEKNFSPNSIRALYVTRLWAYGDMEGMFAATEKDI